MITIDQIQHLIEPMKDCPQDPKWHSEGNVWNHTRLVMSEMYLKPHDDIDMFAAILHDCGKPHQDKINPPKKNGYPNSAGHAEYGAQLIRELGDTSDIKLIAYLVENHMKIHEIKDTTSKFEKWSILQLPEIDRLIKLGDCDTNGCIVGDPSVKKIILTEFLDQNNLYWMIDTPMPKSILTEDYIRNKQIIDPIRISKMLKVAYKIQIDQDINEIATLYHRVKSIRV